jgi:hypothetical protein
MVARLSWVYSPHLQISELTFTLLVQAFYQMVLSIVTTHMDREPRAPSTTLNDMAMGAILDELSLPT